MHVKYCHQALQFIILFLIFKVFRNCKGSVITFSQNGFTFFFFFFKLFISDETEFCFLLSSASLTRRQVVKAVWTITRSLKQSHFIIQRFRWFQDWLTVWKIQLNFFIFFHGCLPSSWSLMKILWCFHVFSFYWQQSEFSKE